MDVNLIKDNHHANIIISNLEKSIINHKYFNRLNRISQMGHVQLVFPTVTHTRFSHSIGVMHLAGNIYRNALANADPEIVARYLVSKFEALEKLATRIRNKISSSSSDTLSNEIFLDPDGLGDSLGSAFLSRNAIDFNNISKYADKLSVDNLRITYYTMLQIVRIYGLLHDVGHMPTSHLLEYALQYHLNKKYDIHFKIPLHEILTTVISKLITAEIARESIKEAKYLSALMLGIVEMSAEERMHSLFDTKEDQTDIDIFRKEVYGLIDGPLDADKLDYIIRDGASAGIVNSYEEVDRIVNTIVLTNLNDDFEYSILPSNRAHINIDSIMYNRYIVYDLLISHPRVRKFERLITKFIGLYLDNDIGDESNPVLELIDILKNSTKNIHGKKYIVFSDNNIDYDRFKTIYSQFDDKWFDSWMMRTYNDDNISKSNMKELLEEIYFIRQVYNSGITNTEEMYKHVLKKYIRNVCKNKEKRKHLKKVYEILYNQQLTIDDECDKKDNELEYAIGIVNTLLDYLIGILRSAAIKNGGNTISILNYIEEMVKQKLPKQYKQENNIEILVSFNIYSVVKNVEYYCIKGRRKAVLEFEKTILTRYFEKPKVLIYYKGDIQINLEDQIKMHSYVIESLIETAYRNKHIL